MSRRTPKLPEHMKSRSYAFRLDPKKPEDRIVIDSIERYEREGVDLRSWIELAAAALESKPIGDIVVSKRAVYDIQGMLSDLLHMVESGDFGAIEYVYDENGEADTSPAHALGAELKNMIDGYQQRAITMDDLDEDVDDDE